jgi:hypothetical protein
VPIQGRWTSIEATLMKNPALKAIAVFFLLTVLRPAVAAEGENPVDQPKRVHLASPTNRRSPPRHIVTVMRVSREPLLHLTEKVQPKCVARHVL